MAILETANKAEGRGQSKIEHCYEEIRQASACLSDLTKLCRNLADGIDGGTPETNEKSNPRECRAGQIGSLQDSCDQLHRRINSLNDQISRLQTGLGI